MLIKLTVQVTIRDRRLAATGNIRDVLRALWSFRKFLFVSDEEAGRMLRSVRDAAPLHPEVDVTYIPGDGDG